MFRNRHSLAHVSPASRPGILAAVLDALPEQMRDGATRKLVRDAMSKAHIPGIVCRPTGPCPDGGGQLGFAFPFRHGAERVRAAVPVRRGQVTAFFTPYEVMERALILGASLHPALPEIARIGAVTGVEIGLIGSAALQTVTGLPYLRPGSDIDLVVRADSLPPLAAAARALERLSYRQAIAIDAEADLAGGIGVKLTELVSGAATVLGKTITGVELIERERLNTVFAVPSQGRAAPQHPMKQAERRRPWM
ncbi:phosphoribosyl-dephospho-CoA transferase [Rhodobacter viridis]|uniref:Phosphoribosyl-dephospho-CoA transferase n=1 Tax=Rhodobacter viridis TaxID=1054202 RepID=A0A318TWX8_9RHOB|nr:malonate decarboxylase holo-[acyl-carrier-protein] synthase [Rhodobacter viridis]PYF09144.1 phosphoribosyl-dephospho-CoA transferase [Rhodobacter viridis]